jgi:hypothetical protein
MRMAGKKHHYGRQILVTLLVTVIILLGLFFVFARFLVPLFNVHQDQIYSVLVKLFPLLIGLVLIECGVLIARRRDEDYADQVDLLPPNAYDKPLYRLPGDDPDHAVLASGPETAAKAPQEAVEQELPVEPSESVRNVMVPPAAPIAPVEPQVIIKEVIKEVPVEVQVPVEVPVAGEYKPEEFENSFNVIMDQELQSSIDVGYDISLTLVEITAGDKDAVSALLLASTKENSYSFLLDNGKIAIVLPFYQYEEARRYLLELLDSCKKQLEGTGLQMGFASRNGRVLDVDQLYHEAEVACSLAAQDDEVIGFEENIEKEA